MLEQRSSLSPQFDMRPAAEEGLANFRNPGVQHRLGHSSSTNTSVGRRTSWSTESQGNIGINAQTLGSTLKFDAASTPPGFQRPMG